jgi:hypothetical protein
MIRMLIVGYCYGIRFAPDPWCDQYCTDLVAAPVYVNHKRAHGASIRSQADIHQGARRAGP